MRRLRQASIIAFASTMLACNYGLSPTEAGELLNAEQRWARVGPTSYLIETRLLCFCGEAEGWATLRVESDSIVAITDEQGDSIPRGSWGERTTVAGSFRRMKSMLYYGWDKVTVEFDDRTGYPVRTLFAPGDDVYDGSSGFRFRNLQPLNDQGAPLQ